MISSEKDKAAQDILKILNKFDPDEWQDLIGENSVVQAELRGLLMRKKWNKILSQLKNSEFYRFFEGVTR